MAVKWRRRKWSRMRGSWILFEFHGPNYNSFLNRNRRIRGNHLIHHCATPTHMYHVELVISETGLRYRMIYRLFLHLYNLVYRHLASLSVKLSGCALQMDSLLHQPYQRLRIHLSIAYLHSSPFLHLRRLHHISLGVDGRLSLRAIHQCLDQGHRHQHAALLVKMSHSNSDLDLLLRYQGGTEAVKTGRRAKSRSLTSVDIYMLILIHTCFVLCWQLY